MSDSVHGKALAGMPDHGRRLTDDEYQRRVAELYAGASPMPSPAEDLRLRRGELNLRIDYRLGAGFPADRREALWLAQQRVERQRLRNVGRVLLANLLPGGRVGAAGAMSRFLVKAYEDVLSPAELECFLDLASGEAVSLPIDDDGLNAR